MKRFFRGTRNNIYVILPIMNFIEYCKKLSLPQKYYNIFAYFYDYWNFKKKFNLSEEIEKEVKKLLWEMYQISKWIDDLLESWNIISSIILLRTLFERVILFRIIFEDKSKIEDRIKIYLDFWDIQAYEWLKNDGVENKSEYFRKFEKTFEEKNILYVIKNKKWDYYDLYKWLLWKKHSFNFLSKKYIKNPLEDYWIKDNYEFYSILSSIHHWNPLNIAFLNSENSFLPNHNLERKEEINIFVFQLILLLAKDLENNGIDF